VQRTPVPLSFSLAQFEIEHESTAGTSTTPSNFFNLPPKPATTTTGTTGICFLLEPHESGNVETFFLLAAPKVNTGLFGGTSAATGDSGTSTTKATSNIFGSGTFGKPATGDSGTSTANATTTNATSNIFGSGTFGNPAATGDSGTSTANASTANAASNIFGSGIFGKPATTSSATITPAAVAAPIFSLGGGNKDAPALARKS
jgi:hypothetical protein